MAGAIQEDFPAAAARHWFDANTLQARGGLPNADHLFGLAAECAIKCALTTLPGFSDNGRLNAAYHLHIDKLWDRVRLQSIQKRYPLLWAVLGAANPYDDWMVDQRYENGSSIAAAAVDRHKTFAKRLLGAMGVLGSRLGAG